MIMSADLYIPKIRNDGNWMGDLDISVVHLIYDCNVFIFEINNEQELILISINGDKNNKDKFIVNLCLVNNNHYIVLNEPNRKKNIPSNIKRHDVKYLDKK